MGRSQYLARLALGRSAFEDLEPDQLREPTSQASPGQTSVDEHLAYHQQYDSKGRPINPSTDERNAAMRNAGNAALSLVGVVERKDSTERANELKYRRIREEREVVLAAEQDAGESVELIVTLMSLNNYTTEMLLRRVQAGLYPSSDTFASIVLGGLREIRNAGLRGSFAILFPGAPASILHSTIRVILGVTLSTCVDYLSPWLIRQKMKKRTIRRLLRLLHYSCEALLVCIDVALLPLDYYACAQQLGLAPAYPLLPSWRTLLPSNPASIHHFGWQSTLTIPILHRLCSPAVQILLYSTLWREQDAEIPVGSHFTNFQYPSVFNVRSWDVERPLATRDPWGWILYQGHNLRSRLMKFLGYHLEGRAMLGQLENDRLPGTTQTAPLDNAWSTDDEDGGVVGGDGLHHAHRSTELARVAPRYLAQSIDEGYAKLLLLPLQALVVRSVTQSYLASGSPKTPFALAAMPHFYAPSFVSLRGREMGSYLSKLGLSLTLHAANSVGVFFLVYKLVRWQGRRNFDWGSPGRIGGVVCPTQGEE